MKLFQRWLAVACIGAGLSAPASANTIVTFSVDHVTFAGPNTNGTFLMEGTFDWDQTANTLSSNFNLTSPDRVPLSPIWTTNFTFIGTNPTPLPGSQLFGFRDDSGNVGIPPDFIEFSFVHDPNASFISGQTFSVADHDSTFPNQLLVCGSQIGGGCPFVSNFTTADSTLVVTNVSVPGPITGAGLPGLIMALGGLLAWRRRKSAALAA